MKTIIYKTLLLAVLTVLIPLQAYSERIAIETPNTLLLLQVEREGDIRQLYYGMRLHENPMQMVIPEEKNAPSCMPCFGSVDLVELPALQVQHANGDQTLVLRVKDWEQHTLADGVQTTIRMYDAAYPIEVRVCYRAYKEVDIIETWTEIEHREKKDIILKRFDSGHLTIRQGNVWLTHLHGNWAAETIPTHEPLTKGLQVIRNTDGARNAHIDAPEVMLSLDGCPKENTGRVIGAALCWSGNYELRFNTWDNRYHHFYAGINPQASEYVLSPKQVFTTPKLALTYSENGLGGVSRSFHRWARYHGMVNQGDKVRKILLNSWEGIYFDITEERIIDMIEDISGMGGELFVMDDGWFGGKYQRNSDNSSLGDWVVDKRKLPNGIGALTRAARANGIQFGIWIEPEATNTTSELFERHPEWALQVEGRELRLGRGGTQLVLDMTNPQVQDYVFSIVDNLLTEYPEIVYIKWDANASIQNYGSTYLPKHKQTNLYIDYHLGLVKTLQRIRAKYPNIVIQNCASGGGRANYGLMPYFEEFWVSDNNDALQRIYIQWATSYFFPSNVMAQHIGGSPYHMTGRRLPIKFRCDVAMSGRLGMELQPRHMTDEERQQATVAINDYKRLREVIQLGNLYRLVSPFEVGHTFPNTAQMASLMYVNDDQSRAVWMTYRTSFLLNQSVPTIHLQGLNPTTLYRLYERNIAVGQEPSALHGQTFTGEYLMRVGMDVAVNSEYASRVYELCAVDAPIATAQELLHTLQTACNSPFVLFGQHDATLYGHTWYGERGRSDCRDLTGAHPFIISFDLGHIERGSELSIDSVPFAAIRQAMSDHHERGGIVSVSWHPTHLITGGTAWDNSMDTTIRTLLPQHANHHKLTAAIDKLAQFLQPISVPILFRPWHEMNGNWFWWGSSCGTPDEYKQLYRFTHDYIQQHYPQLMRNLLWAYSPNLGIKDDTYMRYYPGDQYVDVLGVDCYHMAGESPAVFQSNLSECLTILSKYGQQTGKPIALTETGFERIPQADWWTQTLLPIIEQYPLSYVLVWRNAHNMPQHYYLPFVGDTSAEDFVRFYQAPYTKFCNPYIL